VLFARALPLPVRACLYAANLRRNRDRARRGDPYRCRLL